MTASFTHTETRWSALGDLPPAWQLLPFLAVTGLLMWWLGRRLPATAWLGVWAFFAIVGFIDFKQQGALGAWLVIAGAIGFYVTGWVVVRRRLPVDGPL